MCFLREFDPTDHNISEIEIEHSYPVLSKMSAQVKVKNV